MDIYNPWVDTDGPEHEYGICALGKTDCVLFDVKHILPVDKVDDRL